MPASVSTVFSQAAPFYRFRAPYAPDAFTHIQTVFRLDPHSRVLDLGCGPGTVTIPLARMVGAVVAVDPCAEMIEEGRTHAAGYTNIRWLHTRAEDVTDGIGRFHLATMGQSFHWMDRDRVLRQLARIIEPGGGLALINPGRRRPQESWEAAVHELIARYIPDQKRHPSKHAEPEHEPSLRRSACFSEFSAHEYSLDFERDIAAIIGYVYSSSTSPKSAFGERAETFERKLEDMLLRMNPAGVFKERVETEVIVALKRT